jgi:hypothetical protein
MRWRKVIEVTFEQEVSALDAAAALDGNADVLAAYEDDNMATEYAVTEREVETGAS